MIFRRFRHLPFGRVVRISRSKGHSVGAIIRRLNEEADTARRYLDLCELEVLYEVINKRASQRVKLPEGVFDMTTAIHGIYE